MFKLINNWYKNKVTAGEIRAAKFEAERKLTEHFGTISSNIARDTDLINGLFDVNQHSDLEFRIPQIDRATAVNQSRNFVRTNGHAKNVLTQIINHVVGVGFEAKLKDKSHQQKWEEIQKLISWDLRIREIVKRVCRDGEVFLRKFGDEVRFIEPEWIGSPIVTDASIIDGIQFVVDEGIIDFETPAAYFRTDGAKVIEEIPAEEVYHFTDPHRDMTDARGWPIFIDPMRDFMAYNQVIEYRIHLNKIRAAYAFIRTHEFSHAGHVEDFIQNTKDGDLIDPNGRSRPTGNLPAGLGLELPAGQKVEFMPPNVGANDVAEDLRSLRLIMGAHFSFPEYLISGDSSNSNYASTAVAESPGVRALQSWQQYFSYHFEKIIEWLLEVDVEPDFTFPNLVIRDHLKEQQARQIQKSNDVISVETWQILEGIDPEIEKARVDADREERMERAPDFTPSENKDDEDKDKDKDNDNPFEKKEDEEKE